MKRTHHFTFEGKDVSEWKYCPICGAEILEVYPGDHFGYISCMGEIDSCEIDFEVSYREVSE